VKEDNWAGFDELADNFNFMGRKGDLYAWVSLGLAVLLIPAAYGGIHLGAIHSMFPTAIELTLWKSACFVLLGVAGLSIAITLGIAPLVLSIQALDATSNRMPNSNGSMHLQPKKEHKSKLKAFYDSKFVEVLTLLFWMIIYTIVFISLVVIALLYISARIFIVVESFISSRHVPIGVYQTPVTNVMGYIPHL